MRNRRLTELSVNRLFLSFLIYQKLGIFSVFFISAHKKEIHICGNTKASATQFTLKLTSEVGLFIVKKFDPLCVRQRIFHIDEFA